MLESLNYSFRSPKNIIWVIYRIIQLRNWKKNHGVLRGPQLGKQRWRPRLGILRVNIPSLTISTAQRANSSSAGQEIPRNLWKPNVQDRVRNSPPLAPFPSQVNSAHSPLYHLKINFNIILTTTPAFEVFCYPQVSPPKPCTHLASPPYVPHPSSNSVLLIW